MAARAALAAILILAGTVRCLQFRESLWLDELHTAWTASDGLGAVAERARIGNHTPTYFLLVWGSVRACGLTELAVRLPSLAAGLALVAMLYFAVRRWTGSAAAGLFAALLAAVEPTCIWYAQEARPYAWVQFGGLAQIILFAAVLDAPTYRRRAGFVTLSWLLFYLHYTAVLLLSGELVGYAILFTRSAWRPQYRPRQLWTDLGVFLLGCLPTLPHVLEIAGRRANWAWFVQRQPWWAVGTMFPWLPYCLVPTLVWGGAWFVPRVPLLGPPSSAGARRRAQALLGGPSSGTQPEACAPHLLRPLVLATCWFFVPLVLAWVSTATDLARLFFPRYLIVTAVAPLVVAGLLFQLSPGPVSRGMCASATLLVAIGQSGMLAQWRYDGRLIGSRHQDWRSAAATINSATPYARWPVFVSSGFLEADGLRGEASAFLRDYCRSPLSTIYRVQREESDLLPLPTSRPGQLAPENRRRVIIAGGAWLVALGEPERIDQMQRDALQSLREAGCQPQVEQREAFGNVAVLRLSPGQRESDRGRR